VAIVEARQRIPHRGCFAVTDPVERFWAKVDQSGECWVWTASANNVGYGWFWDGQRNQLAHRWAYELLVGPIPDGLQLDHLCRNRRCVRPDHLEAVTRRENILRGVGVGAKNAAKTHCLRNHPFDEANTHLGPSGKRFCRLCTRDRNQRRRPA
jgi:hypothetical protein